MSLIVITPNLKPHFYISSGVDSQIEDLVFPSRLTEGISEYSLHCSENTRNVIVTGAVIIGNSLHARHCVKYFICGIYLILKIL